MHSEAASTLVPPAATTNTAHTRTSPQPETWREEGAVRLRKPPACFAHPHTPKSFTASGRTVRLLGRAGGPVEPFVAAGTMTARIFSVGCLVIALATLARIGGPAGTNPLTVATGLLPTALLPCHRGPIRLIGQPPRPTPRRLPAHRAAVPTPWMVGNEPPFAPLQQTKASPGTRSVLHGGR